MVSGTVLIVDNHGDWCSMIEYGKTGWLCDHPDDFIRCASRMAHKSEERCTTAVTVRGRLKSIARLDVAKTSWQAVLQTLDLQSRRLI